MKMKGDDPAARADRCSVREVPDVALTFTPRVRQPDGHDLSAPARRNAQSSASHRSTAIPACTHRSDPCLDRGRDSQPKGRAIPVAELPKTHFPPPRSILSQNAVTLTKGTSFPCLCVREQTRATTALNGSAAGIEPLTG